MNIFLDYIIFILILLFAHMLSINTQNISSKQYFYGVYIKQINIDENIEKEIDKDFKLKLNISLLIVIIIYIIFNLIFKLNIGLNIMVSTTIYLALYYIFLKNEYKKVKNIKNNYLVINEENVKTERKERKFLKEDNELRKIKLKIIKKFKILFGICIVLSILSFLYVLVNYNSMPETIITHWGSGGRPDGFAKKNIIDVFYTNFIDICMVILLAVMGVGSVSSNTYIDNKNLEINRKKAIKYLNGIGYSFFIMTLTIQSVTTTIPIFMVKEKNIPLQLTLFVCIAPIFISVALIYFYIMLGSLKPKDKSLYAAENDDEKWIYGFIYYNEEDPCLMVEKRLGAGWSMNMAHPLGKVMTFILLLTLAGTMIICFI
ncbi:DUF1648 domain-containing protein [Romboutsia ilealis]|uniref:DUF1648 domain-containing protein n=1 Tax=Romboutsia faecis TaxID=2764597 RepID=A0ABR7JPL6_9FIRM|nr:DUF1648 domain-containing protein [Romboutsia faecis]MBC5996864.1 DUF1648 domain-containing protein [Romboutsia faecis]MRN24632.1 DUF1648 domain-containing protein [Romboutsia ilealis]